MIMSTQAPSPQLPPRRPGLPLFRDGSLGSLNLMEPSRHAAFRVTTAQAGCRLCSCSFAIPGTVLVPNHPPWVHKLVDIRGRLRFVAGRDKPGQPEDEGEQGDPDHHNLRGTPSSGGIGREIRPGHVWFIAGFDPGC